MYAIRSYYGVIGFVDDNPKVKAIHNCPVLGTTDDLPELILSEKIREVIVAMPDATHHEILSIVSKCDPGKVSIKVFPDVFQIMASEVSIGELGGLPLLSVRDTAMRNNFV